MKTARSSRTARPEIPSPAFASPLPPIGPEARPPPGRRVVGPVQGAARLVEDVDPGAVGAEQAGGLVDGALEDLLRVTQGDDPAADLAQRALRLGAPLDVRPRPAELLDQVGVRHRRGGMVGEGSDQGYLGVAEGVGRLENVPIAPYVRAPLTSGATTNEWMSMSWTRRSASGKWTKDVSDW